MKAKPLVNNSNETKGKPKLFTLSKSKVNTNEKSEQVLAAHLRQDSSGQLRNCSNAVHVYSSILQCRNFHSTLSAPTLMGHFYSLNVKLQTLHTMRRVDVVLVATPNQVSSGLIREAAKPPSFTRNSLRRRCRPALHSTYGVSPR